MFLFARDFGLFYFFCRVKKISVLYENAVLLIFGMLFRYKTNLSISDHKVNAFTLFVRKNG